MSGTTSSTGQVFLPPPPLHTPATQQVEGGVLEAAANKTMAARAAQIETAEKMGAGQKGAGRRRKTRRRIRGGAENLNAPASNLPSAGSIPGVDPTNTHIAAVDGLNAMRAAGVYDKLHSAAPYYPKSGGKRTKRKAKHGRRHHRTNRRGHGKSTRRHRGGSRRV